MAYESIMIDMNLRKHISNGGAEIDIVGDDFMLSRRGLGWAGFVFGKIPGSA